jgi:hypothetical protein
MSMSGIQFREAWLSNALQLIDQQSATIDALQKQVADLQKQLAEKQPIVAPAS